MIADALTLTGALLPTSDEEKARPAFLSPDGATTTYGDLDRRSSAYARALTAAGADAGSRVMVVIDKSIASVVLYLAVLRAGAVYVPLNPAHTRAELEYYVADADPSVVVCSPERATEFEQICRELPVAVLTLDTDGGGTLVQSATTAEAHDDARERLPEDAAAILYTSGTTGRPKGAVLSHRNLLSNAMALRDAWGYTSEDVLLHALPLFHTHGLFVGVNLTMLCRASALMLARFDPVEVVDLLPRASVLMGVPTYYARLMHAPGLREASSAMRLFISGSAPLPAEAHARWLEMTGHAILERYGMTETTMIASNPLRGPRRPGTVGSPLADIVVRIADADDEGIGMIQVAGPNVFQGYWRMPDKTAQEFTADGFFITGDLGRFGDDGYLQIVGRAKDLVIRGGFNVYPKELEDEIDALDAVIESAVFGVPDVDLGERIVAAIVLQEGAPPDRDTIARHLGSRLARYKNPDDYVFVSELPRNVMGKVQKALLRQRYAADVPTA